MVSSIRQPRQIGRPLVIELDQDHRAMDAVVEHAAESQHSLGALRLSQSLEQGESVRGKLV